MPSFQFQDMKVSVGAFGDHDVHVQLRTLDEKLTIQQLAALLYPLFDAQEKQKGTP